MPKIRNMQLKRWLSGLLVFSLIVSLFYAGGVQPVSAASNDIVDIKGHWAEKSIKEWVKTGVIKGYQDNTFRPDAPITRADIAAVLNNLMQYQAKSENTFSDLGNQWYAEAILGANASGIIVGNDGRVRPEAHATREETVVMLAKALAVKGGGALRFTDSEKISAWAANAVNAMAERGYINGLPDGRFNPKENITRAEVAAIISNSVKGFYSKAGTYIENVNGTAVVNTSDVILKDMTITGDLILAEGVGNGDVTLDNVNIKGNTIVRGGGENSIIIKNSSKLGTLTVCRIDGKVSVKVQDSAEVEMIVVEDGSDDVIITGEVGNLQVDASDITVTAKAAVLSKVLVNVKNTTLVIDEKSSADTIAFNKEASNATATINGRVKTLVSETAGLKVNGDGKLETAEIKGNDNKIEVVGTKVTAAAGVTGTFAGTKSVATGTSEIVQKPSTPPTPTPPPTTPTEPSTPTPTPTPSLSSVTISGDNSVEKGSTLQLSVSGTVSNGEAANLTGAANEWTIVNENVATIDKQSGLLTAVEAGTAKVTVTVTLDGKTLSTTFSITVTVPINLALHKPYKISLPPELNYPDSGNSELTDGIYGAAVDTDDVDEFIKVSSLPWQGHAGKIDREVVIDLDTPGTITAIKATFLEFIPFAINAPDMLDISVSMDGKKWAKVAEPKRMPPSGAKSEIVPLNWSAAEHGLPDGAPAGTAIYARYVKIHAIVNVWLFMDEIEVWGATGKQAGAVELTPGENGGSSGDYLKAGEATGGIQDLMLFYNGQYPDDAGNWSAAQFLPYATYVDQNGEVQDWLFDGGLFLGLYSKEGRSFWEDPGAEPSRMEDWQWYLDKTFDEQHGDVTQLNEAMKQAKEVLNAPGHKMKVTFMIPFPTQKQADFGDVDGDGISENFSDPQTGQAAREKAVAWYVSQLNAKWAQGQYPNLELVGFYWLSEGASADDLALVEYTSNLVHDQAAKLFWIPYFNAPAYYKWNQLGFDAMAYQPNHFFNETSAERIAEAMLMARLAGSGIEIELDERALTQSSLRQKYIDYLQGTVEAGITPDVFKAYYQGNRTFYQAAYAPEARNRQLYDWIYDYVKGKPIDFSEPDGPTNLALHKKVIVSAASSGQPPITDVECLTDGEFGPDDNIWPWPAEGKWNIYSGGDRQVLVDLGAESAVERIRMRFIQEIPSGVYFPEKVKMEISSDGENWNVLGEVDTAISEDQSGPVVQWFTLADLNQTGRYVRITVPIRESWAFADELEVYGK